MQVVFKKNCNRMYIHYMPVGRPSSNERTSFGERLCFIREKKGFSQKQMSKKLEITQQAYAAWERIPRSLKPEQLSKLSSVLEISIDELIGIKAPKKKSGPIGKIKKVFDAVSELPRHKQNKVAEFVEAYVNQQKRH